MKIKENVSLKPYNTFGIDVNARFFCSVESEDQLVELLKQNTHPVFLISGGSNMLLTKNIDALVIHINIRGIKVEKDEDSALVTAKAGENWHNFVQYCIAQNLGGLENLSLIPGYVGSAPIQNIGAYGVELKDRFLRCKALNKETLQFEIFNNEECKFGYRDSVFKNEAKGKYIITEVTFKLSNQHHKLNTGYGAIINQLKDSNVENPTIESVANAVIAIRQSKLPDPKVLGNSGSFFKNPVVLKETYIQLKEKFEELPHYTVNEEYVKIPAGWLIDKAGLKGYVMDNAAVHNKQALVLVNKTGNATGSQILELAKYIQQKVNDKYGINLEPEVNVF